MLYKIVFVENFSTKKCAANYDALNLNFITNDVRKLSFSKSDIYII